MIGPGKYDDLCTEVRDKAAATGAIVIVFEGRHGYGFSAQLNAVQLRVVPSILRELATQIELNGHV